MSTKKYEINQLPDDEDSSISKPDLRKLQANLFSDNFYERYLKNYYLQIKKKEKGKNIEKFCDELKKHTSITNAYFQTYIVVFIMVFGYFIQRMMQPEESDCNQIQIVGILLIVEILDMGVCIFFLYQACKTYSQILLSISKLFMVFNQIISLFSLLNLFLTLYDCNWVTSHDSNSDNGGDFPYAVFLIVANFARIAFQCLFFRSHNILRQKMDNLIDQI